MEIITIGPNRLDEYERIPSRLMVRSILQVEVVDGGMGGLRLHEVTLARPYLKDYDVDEKPSDWPRMFDTTRWGFFLAIDRERTVGGAAVAFDTTGVFLLENRRDLAVLWDLRVAPEGRGAGIPLFRRAVEWARGKGCRQMKIETQNVNVPACRFYQKMGAELEEIHRHGYAAVPQVADEVMLNWYLDLT